MRRRILIVLVVCLLIGALVNVLVAWGLSAWGPGGSTSASYAGSVVSTDVNGATVFGYSRGTVDAKGSGWTSVATDHETPPNSGTYVYSVRWRAGWPLHSMGASYRRTSTTPALGLPAVTTRVPPGLATGLPIGSTGTVERRLGLTPLWPGLVVNTALFAALPLGVAGFVLWRRLRRERLAGCCGNCGYPIGVSPVCTECGAAVPLRPMSPEPS